MLFICPKCKLEKPAKFSKNGRRRNYCDSCNAVRVKAYIAADPQRRMASLERAKIWRQKNKDRYLENIKLWRLVNPDRYKSVRKSYGKYWRAINKSKCFEYYAAYKTAKLIQAPCWLSEEQQDAMLTMYKIAASYNSVLDSKYEIDHVVPLRGIKVSGLHVPWNLRIITKNQNRSKSNNFAVS